MGSDAEWQGQGSPLRLQPYGAESAAPLGAGGSLFVSLRGGRARVAAACSVARNEPSSAIVLISGAGKTTVVFLSTLRPRG